MSSAAHAASPVPHSPAKDIVAGEALGPPAVPVLLRCDFHDIASAADRAPDDVCGEQCGADGGVIA